jgi:hypothetical protein
MPGNGLRGQGVDGQGLYTERELANSPSTVGSGPSAIGALQNRYLGQKHSGSQDRPLVVCRGATSTNKEPVVSDVDGRLSSNSLSED